MYTSLKIIKLDIKVFIVIVLATFATNVLAHILKIATGSYTNEISNRYYF